MDSDGEALAETEQGLWSRMVGRYSLRDDVKRGMGMADEHKQLMHGTTPDGQTIYWLPQDPWIIGDPELAAKVETRLVRRDTLDEGIMVTATGPFVPAKPSEQLAVFAAANEVTNHEIQWTNAPDVLFGLRYGAADGPSEPLEDEALKRTVNAQREELGKPPLDEGV